ncbi:morn repeat-containing protein 1 [Limosa lapponica baueri]|uniref:Morn repeat-containing protein 1 n=1 Tax=Limosa lapponica baueri TaxID=1758121 RepID=A0A2I0TX06_LIMLA|nr:morn repeat-containing protein 1 [Limosa lapponica baueri]
MVIDQDTLKSNRNQSTVPTKHEPAVVLSKFKIRVYFCLKGQWRNDVVNEQGAIADCSGDICDGLWINGYPAECFNMDESHSHEKNLWLTKVTIQRKKKGGKKPSGRISAEKAEKTSVSQEKMEDSRSHMTSKEYKLQKDQHLVKNSKTLQDIARNEHIDHEDYVNS